jgi:hypothetical protein
VAIATSLLWLLGALVFSVMVAGLVSQNDQGELPTGETYDRDKI